MITIREALEELGVDRVRRGARAIFDRRDDPALSECATCLIGEAFGGLVGYMEAMYRGKPGPHFRPVTAKERAIWLLEAHFEEHWITTWIDPDAGPSGYPGSRERLAEEVLVFLAEHGTAYEPVVKDAAPVTQEA